MSGNNLGFKLLKRTLSTKNCFLSLNNQYSTTTSLDPNSTSVAKSGISSSGEQFLPPLLSEQAKGFIDRRKEFETNSNEVSALIKSAFPYVTKSEFNQCFNITCDNNSSLFIHARSGYTFCPKCKLVRQKNSFSSKCFSDAEKLEANQTQLSDCLTYYSQLFPGQNVVKFKKADLNSWRIKKTLQMHKASKLFLDTFEEFDCYANYDNCSIYFTYRDSNGNILGHQAISLDNFDSKKSKALELQIPEPEQNMEQVTNKKANMLLLKEAISSEDDYLIITSGVLNACAVYQTSSVTTLCLESCSNFEFPNEFVPFLAQYDRIVFFLPDMATNYQIVHQVSKVLGQDRCYYISSQMGCKFRSPLDALKGLSSSHEFTNMLNDYSVPVNSLASNFADLLNEAKDFLSDPRSSLGYPFHRFELLNDLLGGLRLGEMTVVSGDTGQGKTTFATEMALDVCLHNNLPTAFVSLEMQPKITLLKMGRQLILQEVSLKNFDYFEDAITNVPMFISNCSGYVILKDILLEFEKMCMQFGVRHIVIDHLQYLQGIEMLDNKVISSAEELVSVNRVLRKLKQFVSSYNIHMTILAQPRKMYGGQGNSNGTRILSNHEIAGTVALTQIPDNILILQAQKNSNGDQYSYNRNGNKNQQGSTSSFPKVEKSTKYIEVTKNRFKGSLGTMPLLYCEKSGTFSVAAATHAYENKTSKT